MGLLLGGIFFLGTFRMPGSYDDQPTNAGIYAAIFLVGGMIIDAIDSLRVEQRNTQRLLVRILAQRDKTPGD